MHSARDYSQPISAQNHQQDPTVSLAQYILSSSVEDRDRLRPFYIWGSLPLRDTVCGRRASLRQSPLLLNSLEPPYL